MEHLNGQPFPNAHGAAGVAAYARTLTGENGEVMLELLADLVIDSNVHAEGRIAAATYLVDRAFGRPALRVELDEKTREQLLAGVLASDLMLSKSL